MCVNVKIVRRLISIPQYVNVIGCFEKRWRRDYHAIIVVARGVGQSAGGWRGSTVLFVISFRWNERAQLKATDWTLLQGKRLKGFL